MKARTLNKTISIPMGVGGSLLFVTGLFLAVCSVLASAYLRHPDDSSSAFLLPSLVIGLGYQGVL